MSQKSALRIVQYLPAIRLEEGGVVRAVMDLCTVLARSGNQITLVTWEDVDAPPQWKAGGEGVPRVVRIEWPTRGPFLGRNSLKAVAELMEKADVVHLHTPWTLSNLQWAKIARKRGIPYVVTVHGMLDDWSMRQKNLKKRLALMLGVRGFLNRAARVHCTAEGEMQQARGWFSGRGVSLPLIVDLNEFRVLPGEEPARAAYDALRTNEPKVLFLSRIHPKKGLKVLLRAAKRLQQDGVECRILIAGSGEAEYERILRLDVDATNLTEKVKFLGMVKGVEKLSLYEAADLFVLPTSQENFGLAIVEAMACGTPVMTTRGVDIWPEIERAGAVIVEQSPERIAAELKELLSDRARLKAMGARQREFVFQWLDIDTVASQYEQMYREVMAER